jgi:predicted ATPase
MEHFKGHEEEIMKLFIKNAGPIDSIDLNINSDLTFIYGKNNIGKSYAITILYLILKNFAFEFPYARRYSYGFFPRMRFGDNTINKNFIKEIKNKLENSNEFDITENITKYFSQLLSIVFLSRFENSLHNSFGDISNLNNKMSKEPIYLYMEFDEYIIHIKEKNNKLVVEYDGKGKKYIFRKIRRHLRPKMEEEQVVMYFNEESQFLEDIQLYFNDLYKKSIFSIISKINNVYFLPASRSGLYRALNAFSQILVELAKKRSFLSEKIILPSISEQDSDYFSKINEINVKHINSDFCSIAENIENKLLNGKVSFDQATKQILFYPNNIEINLELLGTSSMIAEVSPIVLYLRYIIGSEEDNRGKGNFSKPIIFIEEPEAHLHPKAQVSLMECFVDLVKMGAKLVITSHSNYMFQKLNNLIAEKKIDKEIINGIVFSQGEKGSFSKTVLISDIGMEDNNFVDVAEELYAEKIQIIEKMG